MTTRISSPISRRPKPSWRRREPRICRRRSDCKLEAAALAETPPQAALAFGARALAPAAPQAAALAYPGEGHHAEQQGQAEETRSERSRARPDQFARPGPLDPDVVATAIARGRIQADDARHDDRIARASGDTTHRTAARLGERLELFGRRDDILHLERILLADVDQRDMLAVLGAIEAEAVDRHMGAAEAGRVGRQIELGLLAVRRDEVGLPRRAGHAL